MIKEIVTPLICISFVDIFTLQNGVMLQLFFKLLPQNLVRKHLLEDKKSNRTYILVC